MEQDCQSYYQTECVPEIPFKRKVVRVGTGFMNHDINNIC